MILFINIIHIFSCIVLIMIVLLQTGKGTDMGSAFGGGTSQTLFGSTGASTFLSKITTVMAVIFMLTCFSLAYISTNASISSNSIMENKTISDTQSTTSDKVPASVNNEPLNNDKVEKHTSVVKETKTEEIVDNKKESVKNNEVKKNTN